MVAIPLLVSLLPYILLVTGQTPRLEVRGNKIYVSGTNNTWAGKGVNLMDTRACGCGCIRSTQEVIRRVDYLFDVIGLDWIRLTLEADNVNQQVNKNQTYLNDIKAIVNRVGQKPGKYVEVSIWISPSTNARQAGDPKCPGGPSANTVAEWNVLAKAFKNQPHVIFGIVNEPQAPTSPTKNSAAVYLRNSMDYTVKKIRETGAQNLILVQCPGWSADCSIYKIYPITSGGVNVAYEAHLYFKLPDLKNRLTTQSTLGYPIFISETAIINDPANYLFEDLPSYQYLVSFCKNNSIPYAAWVFDECCAPSMLSIWNYNTCGAGIDLKKHTNWGKIFLGV